jgi:ABC-type nitrate/sulfonate/bicarbonate transport system permease component
MSPAPLGHERFEAVIEAYGADVSRWPIDARSAMQAQAAEPWAAGLLAHAEALDAVLDQAPCLGEPHRIYDAVIAAAPRMMAVQQLWRRLTAAGVSAGLAAACAAGVAAGLLLTPVSLVQSERRSDPLQDASAWLQGPDVTSQNG